MAKVTALGGIFYKVRDPAVTRAWYEQNLKVPVSEYGWEFRWREHSGNGVGYTVWSPFAQDTDYFSPSDRPFMINLRVDNLDEMLSELAAHGIPQVGKTVDEPYGRFAWILDPDGVKIELWEPRP